MASSFVHSVRLFGWQFVRSASLSDSHEWRPALCLSVIGHYQTLSAITAVQEWPDYRRSRQHYSRMAWLRTPGSGDTIKLMASMTFSNGNTIDA